MNKSKKQLIKYQKIMSALLQYKEDIDDGIYYIVETGGTWAKPLSEKLEKTQFSLEMSNTTKKKKDD